MLIPPSSTPCLAFPREAVGMVSGVAPSLSCDSPLTRLSLTRLSTTSLHRHARALRARHLPRSSRLRRLHGGRQDQERGGARAGARRGRAVSRRRRRRLRLWNSTANDVHAWIYARAHEQGCGGNTPRRTKRERDAPTARSRARGISAAVVASRESRADSGFRPQTGGGRALFVVSSSARPEPSARRVAGRPALGQHV